MNRQHPLVAYAFLGLTSLATSQATLLVGPSGLPEIRDAVAIAAPGDTVLIEPGTYAHFAATVGVTIRAVTPGTVTVAYDPAFAPPPCGVACAVAEGATLLLPPSGQTLHVTDLVFDANTASVSGISVHHRVAVSGRVTLDRCEIRSKTFALRADNATVHLQDCTVAAQGGASGPAAIFAINSDISIVGGSFYGAGAPGQPPSSLAGVAILVAGSRLQMSGATASGGTSAPGGLGQAAVSATFSSSAWISDSTLSGGSGSCAVATQAGPLRLSRCTVVDGAGSSNCLASPIGPPMLGIDRLGPLSPGSTFSLGFTTTPNTLVAVLANHTLGTLDAPTVLALPWWLEAGTSFSAALVLADQNGEANVSWTIPAGPGIAGLALWFQGVSGLDFPLQTSPVVGGIVR